MTVTDPGRKTVTLYRVDQQRRAKKLRTLRKPAWANVVDAVQQSAEVNPPLCLLYSSWEDPSIDFRHETWCFDPNTTEGRELPLAGRLAAAFAADGRTLLAVSDTADQTRELTVNRLRAGRWTTEATVNLIDQRDGGCDVVDAVWAGGPSVTLECPGVDNDYSVFVEQNLTQLTSGAVPGDGTELRPRGPLAKGYDAFSDVTPLDADTAIALLQVNRRCGEWYGTVCPPGIPRAKAVRLDLHTGRVLEVVAVAATDRSLVAVSGGSHGLVYVTEGARGSRVYVRWPGEKHGTPVVGLPATFDRVIAQH